MEIYLVYERESYCQYQVIFVSLDKDSEQAIIEERIEKDYWS